MNNLCEVALTFPELHGSDTRSRYPEVQDHSRSFVFEQRPSDQGASWRSQSISDLHLGTGGAADGFGHEDGEFLKFLGFLEKNFEKVVLLGDIWETLTGALPVIPRKSCGGARESHPGNRCALRATQLPLTCTATTTSWPASTARPTSS